MQVESVAVVSVGVVESGLSTALVQVSRVVHQVCGHSPDVGLCAEAGFEPYSIAAVEG